jgi:hypothetical protein
MELATAKKLEELIDNASLDDEARVREDYSGRGMYGKTTAGIIVSDPMVLVRAMAIFAIDADGIELDDDDHAFLNDMSSGFRTDSMGYDTIVY